MDKRQRRGLYCAGNNAVLKRWRRDALKDPSLTFVLQGQTVQKVPAFSKMLGTGGYFSDKRLLLIKMGAVYTSEYNIQRHWTRILKSEEGTKIFP